MQISYLADHPQFIDILASWVYAHWQPIIGEVSPDVRAAKFKTHLNKDSLPIAWVAHSGNEVYGTASLRVHDLPGREDLTPWLGGVFVGEAYRGRGIGRRLCAVVETKAQSLFPGQPLYLFTLDKQAWYQQQGWTYYGPCHWRGHEGEIMLKCLGG
jgi:GNAT superfamily N-acetyltransferase